MISFVVIFPVLYFGGVNLYKKKIIQLFNKESKKRRQQKRKKCSVLYFVLKNFQNICHQVSNFT